MSDRLHEIMAEIGVLHKELLTSGKINDASAVLEEVTKLEEDAKKHYLNLLLQYYFQENDLVNLKEVLLTGARFDMRFSDVKDAFLNIKSNDENVIDFMEESVVFLKDTNFDDTLKQMYDYYMSNEALQVSLEETIELIKRNRDRKSVV